MIGRASMNCPGQIAPSSGRRAALAALALGLATALPAVAQQPAVAAKTACAPLLDYTVPRLQDDAPQPLCQYSGKVLLIVNTASFCGYTPQYEGLEALYKRYAARGLVVMGFPSNDFNQEPKGNKDIADFCFDT